VVCGTGGSSWIGSSWMVDPCLKPAHHSGSTGPTARRWPPIAALGRLAESTLHAVPAVDPVAGIEFRPVRCGVAAGRCLCGNVRAELLILGTWEVVYENAGKVPADCIRDGGLILGAANDAEPVKLRARLAALVCAWEPRGDAREQRVGGQVSARARAAIGSVALLGALALAGCDGRSSLELTITDAVSGGWVWDATVRIQNRSVTEYYQSDRGSVPVLIDGLSPGQAVLRVEAPYYESMSIPLTLRRGANRLPEPLRMRGLEIPGLASWIIFGSAQGGDIVGELRPVASDGSAVVNHPCLDIWVGARVSVEAKDGLPVRESTDGGWSRGDL
jgi:hypothetical protein